MPFLRRGLAAATTVTLPAAALTWLALPAAIAEAATRCPGPEAMITFASGLSLCQGPGVKGDYPSAPDQAITRVCAGDVAVLVTVLPPTDGPGPALGPGECGAVRGEDSVIVVVA